MQTTLLLDIAADACPDRLALGTLADGLDFQSVRARAQGVAEWLAGTQAQHVVFVGMNGAVLPVLLFAAGLAGLP
ncbi:MAG TPA: long-chain fatty acid--CoA ligase, partial [Chakrabartia sp.]|nr:long-chain fatty acid--CoA ligase [Chakrabartia sp.]